MQYGSMATTELTRIVTTNSHGLDPIVVSIARTDAAEAAAVAYLQRQTAYVIGKAYRVIGDAQVAEDVSHALAEFLYPTCEHGMSLQLCAGPDHFPTADQERAWEI